MKYICIDKQKREYYGPYSTPVVIGRDVRIDDYELNYEGMCRFVLDSQSRNWNQVSLLNDREVDISVKQLDMSGFVFGGCPIIGGKLK